MGNGATKRAKINAEKEKALARIKQAMAAEKQEHERKLKKMMNDAKKQDKATKIRQKDKAIAQIGLEINKLDTQIKLDKKDLNIATDQIGKVNQELNDIDNTIREFQTYKVKQLQIKAIEIDLATHEKRYNDINKNIQATIDKTGQHGDCIVNFLTLTQKLITATSITTIHSNQLNAKIALANDLLSRICMDKLTIQNHFQNTPLEKYIPYLSKEGFIYVEDLKCNDEDEFNDDIIGLIEKGLDHDQIDDNDNKDNDIINKDEITGKELLTKWNLAQYYDKMEDDGWDDPGDWKDITDDDLNDMGFKKGHMNKFKRFVQKWSNKLADDGFIPSIDKRQFAKICLKPWSWEKDQADVAGQTKLTLKIAAPLMGGFFTKIYGGLKEAQQLIGYEPNLNQKQMKAITMIQTKPPIDDDNDDNDNDDNDNKDNDIDDKKQLQVTTIKVDPYSDIRKEWVINSLIEIYSDTDKQWFSGKIENITKDNEGEWLHVKYTGINQVKIKQIQRGSSSIRPPIKNQDDLALQCRTLTAASIVSINIVDTMINEFNQSSDALVIAQGIEGSCGQILKGQGTIRQSVFLAQEILKYKPGFKTDTAKIMWKTLDSGIVHIITSAIKMAEASELYFAFFLKFKQSFNYYSSITQQNPNVSLSVALMLLKKDIANFTKYQQDYSSTVKKLTEKAEKVISDTVTESVGNENFKNDRDNRADVRNKYLEKKRIYDNRALVLDDKLSQIKKKRIDLKGDQEKLNFEIASLTQSIAINEKYKEQYSKSKVTLQNMVI